MKRSDKGVRKCSELGNEVRDASETWNLTFLYMQLFKNKKQINFWGPKWVKAPLSIETLQISVTHSRKKQYQLWYS